MISSQQEAEAALNNQLQYTPPADKKASQEKIKQRVASFCQVVDFLPMTDVDDDLALWIKNSIVSHLSGLGIRFLNPENRDSAFGAYKQEAQKLFQRLSNEKGKILLQQRNTLMIEVEAYHASVVGLLVAKMKAKKSLKIDLTLVQLAGFTDAIVKASFFDDSRPKNQPVLVLQDNTVQINGNGIDSRIATLSFVRTVKQLLDSLCVIQGFTYGNIISPVYCEEGDPRHLQVRRRFLEVASQVESLLEQTLNKGKSMEVSSVLFLETLKAIELELPYHDIKSVETGTSPTSTSFVVFSNISSEWDALSSSRIGNIGLQ